MTVMTVGLAPLRSGDLDRELARIRRINEQIFAREIGPQQVGKWYHNAYWRRDYLVLAIEADHDRGTWSITVATREELRAGQRRTHRTAWDKRNYPVPVYPISLTKNYNTLDVCWTHKVAHRTEDGQRELICAAQQLAWGWLPWSDLRGDTGQPVHEGGAR